MRALLIHVLILAALAGTGALLRGGGPPCETAVVFRSGSEAYADALAGIREASANTPCRMRYFDLADPAGEKELTAALPSSPKLVVAVGVGAWERIRAFGPGLSVLSAVVLRDDLKAEGGSRRAGSVYADVPLASVVERLREIFPNKSRVGLIHRSSRPAPEAAMVARIRELGYELRVVECAGPDKLLNAFSSLRGKVDFVIAEPDSELYNSATLKPLVLASLDQRLPIVGFSAGFVRAGALVGVYPDFHELGSRTGEFVQQLLLDKGRGTEQDVRKLVVAVNQRIARLLGIELGRQEGVEIFK